MARKRPSWGGLVVACLALAGARPALAAGLSTPGTSTDTPGSSTHMEQENQGNEPAVTPHHGVNPNRWGEATRAGGNAGPGGAAGPREPPGSAGTTLR